MEFQKEYLDPGERRIPAIIAELSRLNRSVELLTNLIGSLADKLQPVLPPAPPSTSPSPSQPRASRGEVADHLAGCNEQLGMLSGRVSSMLELIEL